MNKEIPTLNEMLKLYSKKDLWDRIQDKNQIIKQKDQQIAELKKALELACKYSFYYTKVIKFNDCGIEIDNYQDLMKFAINKAKEILKNE